MKFFIVNFDNDEFLIMDHETVEYERQLLRALKEIAFRIYENQEGMLYHSVAIKLDVKGVILTERKGLGNTTFLCKILEGKQVEYIANNSCIFSTGYESGTWNI